ncbi:hypothetical protein GC170_18885 [bacterium]|nr:hypothetical protein [bacterium]
MAHQGQSESGIAPRREFLRKMAVMALIGTMLGVNSGCRSGTAGGLAGRIRDCRLFNIFRRTPQTVVASDPCCGGVVSGAVVSTGDPCGTPVVSTIDPCATTGATVIQQQGAIIQTTPSGVTVPSGSMAVPDLAPLDNRPTSNLDPKGTSLNKPAIVPPSTLQAKTTSANMNYR